LAQPIFCLFAEGLGAPRGPQLGQPCCPILALAWCPLVAYICTLTAYIAQNGESRVIKSFKSKTLDDLWSTGKTAKIGAKMHKRILLRLDRLDIVTVAADMDIPGYNFHPLTACTPTRYTVHVNGPWCITFEFEQGDAYRVNYENYH